MWFLVLLFDWPGNCGAGEKLRSLPLLSYSSLVRSLPHFPPLPPWAQVNQLRNGHFGHIKFFETEAVDKAAELAGTMLKGSTRAPPGGCASAWPWLKASFSAPSPRICAMGSLVSWPQFFRALSGSFRNRVLQKFGSFSNLRR